MPVVTANSQACRAKNRKCFTPHVSRLTSHVSRFTFYALLLTACTTVKLTRPVVKIGLVAPFEGRYRYVGYDAIYAARLALREANAAGGVGGYNVTLVAYDDHGTVSGALTAACNLAQDPDVVAVIGHFRDETTGAARTVYDEAGLPLVVAGTVEGEMGPDMLCSLFTHLGDALGSETQDAPAALQVQLFASSMPGWMRAGVAGLTCGGGLSVTVSEELPPSPGVDAVLLALDPLEAGETLVALRKAGWRGVVAGGPALGSPLFREVAGEAVAGVVFVSPYRWPDTAHGDAEFSAAYQRIGPHVPPPGPFALTTYQATWSLLDVIAGTARQGGAPNRQMRLSQPAATDVYLYRWTHSGTLERVK